MYKQDYTTTPSLAYNYTILYEETTRTLMYKRDYTTTPSLECNYTMLHEPTTRTLMYKRDYTTTPSLFVISSTGVPYNLLIVQESVLQFEIVLVPSAAPYVL